MQMNHHPRAASELPLSRVWYLCSVCVSAAAILRWWNTTAGDATQTTSSTRSSVPPSSKQPCYTLTCSHWQNRAAEELPNTNTKTEIWFFSCIECIINRTKEHKTGQILWSLLIVRILISHLSNYIPKTWNLLHVCALFDDTKRDMTHRCLTLWNVLVCIRRIHPHRTLRLYWQV